MLLADSNVYAPTTVDLMLQGKQFHRAVRGITLAFEALTQQLLTAFFEWLEEKKRMPDIWSQLAEALTAMGAPTTSMLPQAADAMKEVEELVGSIFIPLLNEFREQGSAQSPTFRYWIMFLEAAQLLLLNIRAEREGDWQLHLHSFTKMIPYYFATNRPNYARWSCVYILDMIQLPDDVKDAFEAGQFAIYRSNNQFNGIWSDMAVESTVIRDAKSASGVAGITRKQSALVRWSLTRHLLGEYARAMQRRTGEVEDPSSQRPHEQSKPSMLKQDEKHTEKILHHIRHNMTDPFDVSLHPDVLLNISSGRYATEEVQTSILKALHVGEKAMERFIKASLATDGDRSFYTPITRSGVLTFGEMKQKLKIMRKGKPVTVGIPPEILLRRALTMAKNREEVSLEMVMSRPMSAVPPALFHEDGTMRKTQKADLLHTLERNATSTPASDGLDTFEEEATVYIRDAMAELQMLRGNDYRTFGDLAAAYLEKMVVSFQKAHTVVEVFDRYDNPDSVKAEERARRQTGQATGTYHINDSRPVPPWHRFMMSADNKAALTVFLCEYICKHVPQHRQMSNNQDRSLYLAGGFKDGLLTRCVTGSGTQDAPDLFCSHEEADTRMLLHAWDADRSFASLGRNGRVIIKTPDTDVVVLTLYYYPRMQNTNEFWVETGRVTSTTDLRRYLPIHNICNSLGRALCDIIPAVHALTGCDSVSAMHGIGKKTVMKVLKEGGADTFKDLSLLGECDVESQHSATESARKFVARLYDQKGKEADCHGCLNKLRVRLAGVKNTPLISLPPCEATFIQHVQRASWQAQMWQSSHTAKPALPSPDGNGWERADDGAVSPTFFTGPVAEEVLKSLVCVCTGRSACATICSCRANGLQCTEVSTFIHFTGVS